MSLFKNSSLSYSSLLATPLHYLHGGPGDRGPGVIRCWLFKGERILIKFGGVREEMQSGRFLQRIDYASSVETFPGSGRPRTTIQLGTLDVLGHWCWARRMCRKHIVPTDKLHERPVSIDLVFSAVLKKIMNGVFQKGSFCWLWCVYGIVFGSAPLLQHIVPSKNHFLRCCSQKPFLVLRWTWYRWILVSCAVCRLVQCVCGMYSWLSTNVSTRSVFSTVLVVCGRPLPGNLSTELVGSILCGSLLLCISSWILPNFIGVRSILNEQWRIMLGLRFFWATV